MSSMVVDRLLGQTDELKVPLLCMKIYYIKVYVYVYIFYTYKDIYPFYDELTMTWETYDMGRALTLVFRRSLPFTPPRTYSYSPLIIIREALLLPYNRMPPPT